MEDRRIRATPDAVTMSVRDGVALLELNRPEVVNALDVASLAAIERHCAAIEEDESIGAVVVAGAGMRGFCSGADLSTVRALEGRAKRRFVERAWSALDRVARLPAPTIAALHGHVLGGGLELALACDLRLACASTRIGLPELALGSVPSFGAMQRLPAVIGRGRAVEMILTGARLDAAKALEIGLVTGVAAAGEVRDEALRRAQALKGLPREAVRYMKAALDAPAGPAGHLHGMISDICHGDEGYRSRIARFDRN